LASAEPAASARISEASATSRIRAAGRRIVNSVAGRELVWARQLRWDEPARRGSEPVEVSCYRE
jgi:hypothetical protein